MKICGILLSLTSFFALTSCGQDNNRALRGARCDLIESSVDAHLKAHIPFEPKPDQIAKKAEAKVSLDKVGGDDGLPEGELLYNKSDIYFYDDEKKQIFYVTHQVSYDANRNLNGENKGIGCVRGLKRDQDFQTALTFDLPGKITIDESGQTQVIFRVATIDFQNNKLTYAVGKPKKSSANLKTFFTKSPEFYLISRTPRTIEKTILVDDPSGKLGKDGKVQKVSKTIKTVRTTYSYDMRVELSNKKGARAFLSTKYFINKDQDEEDKKKAAANPDNEGGEPEGGADIESSSE